MIGWKWIAFNVFVLAMLALDLGVFHRHSHRVKIKEALAWSVAWIAMALAFNGFLWMKHGHDVGLQFLTGYVLEKALSVDNIFVFIMIFSYFKVPDKYQHKVLFWGILGALVMRAIFIFAGVALMKIKWMVYVFGALLVVTGIKMAVQKDRQLEPEKNPLLKLLRRMLPVTKDFEGSHFLVKQDGRLLATPLLIVLVFIELTDLLFAIDSIPAVLAVTTDPYIVYTSNIFAILGLRALYFALAGIMGLFRFLSYGLAVVLVFVGAKMIASGFGHHIPVGMSLGVIGSILGIAVVASLIRPGTRGGEA